MKTNTHQLKLRKQRRIHKGAQLEVRKTQTHQVKLESFGGAGTVPKRRAKGHPNAPHMPWCPPLLCFDIVSALLVLCLCFASHSKKYFALHCFALLCYAVLCFAFIRISLHFEKYKTFSRFLCLNSQLIQKHWKYNIPYHRNQPTAGASTKI